jgi:hypothetical protein
MMVGFERVVGRAGCVLGIGVWLAQGCAGGGQSGDTGESSGSSEAEGGDTLAEGCWDREQAIGDIDGGEQPEPFEPFACTSLPSPCGDLDLPMSSTGEVCPAALYELGEITDEAAAEALVDARCIVEALRDGTAGRYAIDLNVDGGFFSYRATYFVLDGGVVTVVDSQEDLDGQHYEAYRALREPAFFAACASATDLPGLLPCLLPTTPNLGCATEGPVDHDACIDATPICS